MAGFNPMEGVTIAKNPWRNTEFGKGTHYFKTAFPSESDSDAVRQQRERFGSVASQAASACSNESGMSNAVCRARYVRQNL